MRIFVLTATYELRVSRKSHFRDHPRYRVADFLILVPITEAKTTVEGI
jgi:hypothetical protein